MGFYQDHILPHLVNLAMRNREFAPYRERTIRRAEGRVLEIGVGSGLNLPLYTSRATEILGLDPLYVANEGRFAVFVPAAQADATLEVMKKVEVSQGSVRIGRVEESPGRTVILQSRIGGNRVVDMLSGEQLPRIC